MNKVLDFVIAFVVLQNVVECLQPIRVGYISGSRMDPKIRALYYVPGQQISGAITVAIDDINADQSLLPNHELVLIPKETYGDEQYSIRATNELTMENASVIIGPQETCKFEARLAAVYDVPMISYVSIFLLIRGFDGEAKYGPV